MTKINSKEIRDYLLGTTEVVGEEIEKHLLTDDDFFEVFQAEEEELIQNYSDGELSDEDKALFESNFLVTDERRKRLEFAGRFRVGVDTVNEDQITEKKEDSEPDENPSRFGFLSGLFASPIPVFAGLLLFLGIGGYFVYSSFLVSSDSDRTIAALDLAFAKNRPIESRVTSLKYSPFSNIRGDGLKNQDQSELQRAESLSRDALSAMKSAENLATIGKVELLSGNFDEAIAHFDQAILKDPVNYSALNDRGTAKLEKAKRLPKEGGERTRILGQALQDFETALRGDSGLPEALFNKAIALEELNLNQRAQVSWEEYLKLDSTSDWAKEAKAHLLKLKEQASIAKPEDRLQTFNTAFRSGDDKKAFQSMSQSRETITGNFVFENLVALALKAEGEERADKISALVYAGEVEKKSTGDPFFFEIAEYYRKNLNKDLESIRSAHALKAEGLSFIIKNEFSSALAKFQESKQLQVSKGNRAEAMYSDYWIAYSTYKVKGTGIGVPMFEQVAGESLARDYKWLNSNANYWLSVISLAENRNSDSIRFAKKGLDMSLAVSDSLLNDKTRSWIAGIYTRLNQNELAYRYIEPLVTGDNVMIKSKRQRGRELDTAAAVLFQDNQTFAAAEFERELLYIEESMAHDPSFARVANARLGLILSTDSENQEALAFAEKGRQISQALKDPKARKAAVAFSDLQIANIYRGQKKFKEGLVQYEKAIAEYASSDFDAYKYELEKGRLMSLFALGETEKIRSALPETLATFEEHRNSIEDETGKIAFFAPEEGIHDLAIEFYFNDGDFKKSFEFSERSKARTLLDIQKGRIDEAGESVSDHSVNVESLINALPDNVRLVQYAVLPERLLIWRLGKGKIEVFESKIAASELDGLVNGYLSAIRSKDDAGLREISGRLYTAVFEPVEDGLQDAEVFVIPDKSLSFLPFDALISSKTNDYLIKQFEINYTPSTSVFVELSKIARSRPALKSEKVLAIGNPDFDKANYPALNDLPGAEIEAEDVVANYGKDSELLVGPNATVGAVSERLNSADVIHYAGHYIVNSKSPELSAFLLSGKEDGALENSQLGDIKLDRPRLIVLSACSTGVEASIAGEGMMGAARSFMAKRVPIVIATQWDVDSDSTAILMSAFHRARKSKNLTSAGSLRQSKLDMIAGNNTNYRHPYYWAAVQLYGGADFS